jgi:hypothetical protein
MRFEVRVGGPWDPDIAEQFGDVHTRVERDCTILSGDLDQAGLHGLLERIRSLGLELIDVRRMRSTRRGDEQTS